MSSSGVQTAPPVFTFIHHFILKYQLDTNPKTFVVTVGIFHQNFATLTQPFGSGTKYLPKNA